MRSVEPLSSVAFVRCASTSGAARAINNATTSGTHFVIFSLLMLVWLGFSGVILFHECGVANVGVARIDDMSAPATACREAGRAREVRERAGGERVRRAPRRGG